MSEIALKKGVEILRLDLISLPLISPLEECRG